MVGLTSGRVLTVLMIGLLGDIHRHQHFSCTARRCCHDKFENQTCKRASLAGCGGADPYTALLFKVEERSCCSFLWLPMYEESRRGLLVKHHLQVWLPEDGVMINVRLLLGSGSDLIKSSDIAALSDPRHWIIEKTGNRKCWWWGEWGLAVGWCYCSCWIPNAGCRLLLLNSFYTSPTLYWKQLCIKCVIFVEIHTQY